MPRIVLAGAMIRRLLTSGRDYQYGGFRAWLRWVFRGIPGDWDAE